MLFIILPQPGKLGKEERVYQGKLEGALPLRNLTFPSLRDRFERELKRGEYGVPAKTKFLWGKILSYKTNSPSPY